MVEIKKKPKESPLALVRRFSSKVRMSGILNEARKRQFYKSSLNQKEKKEKAIRRIEKQKESATLQGYFLYGIRIYQSYSTPDSKRFF